MTSEHAAFYVEKVSEWLRNIVIGLNFCPFARKPYEEKRVNIAVCFAEDNDSILEAVLSELIKLENHSADTLETTLLVLPRAFNDFLIFNDFLHVLEDVLQMEGFEGVFQIASFHPNYQFAGTKADDRENYTNRAPYPILHFLREESVEKALELHPDPDAIPEKNIQCLTQMTEEEFKKIFTFLF